MINKNVTVLALLLGLGITNGCMSTANGGGVVPIENMSEASYAKWRLYITLTAKVATSRLLQEGMVTKHQIELATQALVLVRDGAVVSSGGSILKPALEKVGLNGSEIELVLLVVEQELLSHSALDISTGVLTLRTKEVLSGVIDSLKSATDEVSLDDAKRVQDLSAEFSAKH